MSTLRSFVEGADDSLFSLYNLPLGVFLREDEPFPRIGTAIGDFVLDLSVLEAEGLMALGQEHSLFHQPSLNYVASLGSGVSLLIRQRIQSLLGVDSFELQDNSSLVKKALIPVQKVKMLLPFAIGGFTDFYAGENHASNVGKLFRPNDNPLLPNWKCLPVAYNGRASTVFPSGTPIKRPKGQIKLSPDEPPIYAPSRKLDFELELGFFIGQGNSEGEPISVQEARSHMFGCVLLNDWSARDIQAFEYQPLGPFLAKSFGTSISPWVVSMHALGGAFKPLKEQIPRPVEYLYQACPEQLDIKLKVEIQPAGSTARTTLCETTGRELYWSLEQMLAHHTVNHCIMKPGDLLGTGTISGPLREAWGSLLEITFNGKEPLTLADGKKRSFIEDGDSIIMTGYCEVEGQKIGFGSVEGTILPAN